MMAFTQQRHRSFAPLDRPRELIVACPPMRSNVNLSRIVRTAGCCGVGTLIACGNAKIIDKIARNSIDDGDEDSPGVEIRIHRTLAPPLLELKQQGYRLVGLEQTTGSENLHTYQFARRSVLVVGNERHGIDEEVLNLLNDVVEIPVWGPPHAYNAATAAAMALYEYCRQWPSG
ncbi:MAG TPA: TrmH family RNA methyltransferase [Pirellulales bacterium]|nr:TrmH family RNA methyltransferase [Pirellulales bacterium]